MALLSPTTFTSLPLPLILTPLILILLTYILLFRLPKFLSKLHIWRKYLRSHRQFSLEAGQGKFQFLQDPFSQAPNYWLLHHQAVKYVFSRGAIQETDHRAGFDWFHYAGWEIPTMDPRYKETVRTADQTVHGKLAKSKLVTLLQTAQRVGFEEIERFKGGVSSSSSSSSQQQGEKDGGKSKKVSLHSLMYRLGFNVNCISIFGPDLNHHATRMLLQDFTEQQSELYWSFNLPLPLWLSSRLTAGCRRTRKARQALFDTLMAWYQRGGLESASEEMKAIVRVFEAAGSPPDVGSKFLNMMVVAFMANTPETLGWLFVYVTQAPALCKVIREECDALGEGEDLVQVNFKVATPHLYSAFFETFRQCVFTGTPATVIRPCTLPGIEDHVFQPGDILHSMAEACAMDADVYGPDVRYWKGHRFVGEGDQLLKYDLTFGLGRSPCPGRNFAIAELCMLAARMFQTFDFSEPSVNKRLSFSDGDFELHEPVKAETVDIIDLDGQIRTILYPGNASDTGVPGMTAANIPANDFACRLTPRV